MTKTDMHNVASVGELINKLIDTYRLRSRFTQVRIKNAWDKLMPDAVLNRTRSIYFHDGVLTITVISAPLRNDLSAMERELKNKLNDELGEQVIERIVAK
jgi:abortive infection bacteriophage resistance protein